MIRHSSSLFLSLLLHIAIIAVVFFIYESVTHIKKVKLEKKICVKLCTLKTEKQQIQKPKPKPKKVLKKKVIKHKPKKVYKPKPRPKPKPKKVLKKKVIKHKPKKVYKPKPKPKKIVKILKTKPVVSKKVKEQEHKTYAIQKTNTKKTTITNNTLQKQKTEIKERQSQEDRIKEVTKKYINNNEDKIRQLINDNLYYPRKARKRGIEGIVKIKFKLSKNSIVSDIKIISSKHDILSRSAKKTLNELSKKFPKPSEELIINIPIVYKLR